MKKKICWFMLVLLTGFSACAQYDDEKDFEVETLEGGKSVRIIDYAGEKQEVRIPPRIQGKTVTEIGFGAFGEKEAGQMIVGKGITSVTIPNGVTSIGVAAFIGNNLTSIVIPNSVTSIGQGAFANNQLTSVVIPNSVTSIGQWAFAFNQLNSVTIGNSVTTIEEEAFNKNQLTSLVIPDSVTSIGDNAFSENQLTSVIIPNSVLSIGREAFLSNQLTSVILGDSVTIIGEGAFAFNQLNSVTFGNNIREIGSQAFANNQLTSVTIPDSVTSFSEYVFDGNQNINLLINNFELWNGLYTGMTRDQVIAKARDVFKVTRPVQNSDAFLLDLSLGGMLGDNYKSRFPSNISGVGLVSPMESFSWEQYGAIILSNIDIFFSNNKLFVVSINYRFSQQSIINTLQDSYGEPVRKRGSNGHDHFIWETPLRLIFLEGSLMLIVNKQMLRT